MIDIQTIAVVDTGSSISTICQNFYEEHLHHIPLKPVTDILQIESADGQILPYSGDIQCPLTVYGMGIEKVSIDGLFFDCTYNIL